MAETEKTIDILQNYYERLQQQRGWESFLADDMVFLNNGKKFEGKSNYLEVTRRFFSTVQSLEVEQLITDGDMASSVVRYTLKSPQGKVFTSYVAEFFKVKFGKFEWFAIYFDSAPFNS